MLRFVRAIFSVLGDIERICSVFSVDFKPIFCSQVGGLDRSEWVDMLRFRHSYNGDVEHDMWVDYDHYQNTGEPDVFDEEDIDEVID